MLFLNNGIEYLNICLSLKHYTSWHVYLVHMAANISICCASSLALWIWLDGTTGYNSSSAYRTNSNHNYIQWTLATVFSLCNYTHVIYTCSHKFHFNECSLRRRSTKGAILYLFLLCLRHSFPIYVLITMCTNNDTFSTF